MKAELQEGIQGYRMTPTGKCEKCGLTYYGWALTVPEHRTCECGGEIEVEI